MPLAAQFHPEAQADFYAAIDWYDNARPGLGKAFDGAVQVAIKRASASPNLGSPFGNELRRVFVDAFPYYVLYAVESTRILVVAVAHFRQRPRYWQHRLP